MLKGRLDWVLYVSRRYFRTRRREKGHTAGILSILGIAAGVMTLIAVLAVMNGFQRDLRDRILGITSHIVVGRYDATISDYHEVIDEIKRENGVTGASPYIYTQVMLSSGRGVSGALLRGIDPQTATEVVNIQKDMIRGNLSDLANPASSSNENNPGIILGVELANNL
ncbi:ABC transporter permease, partial [Salinispira pacifica]